MKTNNDKNCDRHFYQILNRNIIQNTINEAKNSKRKRKNFNLHELNDSVQRFINVIEPDSYVRPHRHLNPPKIECFVVIEGNCTVVLFDDIGKINHCITIDRNINYGIDIKPGIWHTIISNQIGTILFEVKNDPYVPICQEDYPSWAPDENDLLHEDYFNELKQKIRNLIE